MISSTSEVESQLLAINLMSKHDLEVHWRKLYRTQPPASIRRDLLVQALAYKLQEQQFSGLSNRTRRLLRSCTKAVISDNHRAREPDITLKPGTKLLREWHGRTYQIVVLEDGFEFEGRRYATLTKIAREITGTHWSGPRFFGVKRPSKPFASQKEVCLEELCE